MTDDPEPLPEIPLVMRPETSKAKAVVDGNYGYATAGDRHKLGGDPDWIPGDETPERGEPMEFYGQLDDLGSVEQLKDGGMIHVFLCRECHAAGSVLQYG